MTIQVEIDHGAQLERSLNRWCGKHVEFKVLDSVSPYGWRIWVRKKPTNVIQAIFSIFYWQEVGYMGPPHHIRAEHLGAAVLLEELLFCGGYEITVSHLSKGAPPMHGRIPTSEQAAEPVEHSKTTKRKTTVTIETSDGPVFVIVSPKFGKGRKQRITVISRVGAKIVEEKHADRKS